MAPSIIIFRLSNSSWLDRVELKRSRQVASMVFGIEFPQTLASLLALLFGTAVSPHLWPGFNRKVAVMSKDIRHHHPQSNVQ